MSIRKSDGGGIWGQRQSVFGGVKDVPVGRLGNKKLTKQSAAKGGRKASISARAKKIVISMPKFSWDTNPEAQK